MAKQPAGYRSYLLRLWRARGRDRAVWRASLQSPMTGERLGFASLRELFAFLETEAGATETSVADDQVPAPGEGSSS